MSLNRSLLDSVRLLGEVQRVSGIIQSLTGCLEPAVVARRTVEGLVQQFGYAFARIWLVELDQTTLHLVASAGMYTRIDGSFARVPMGAYKIGKIAQNRIPFLSNNLSEETWVRDRAWSLETGICGFAGYPLTHGEKVLGVLAVFHRQPMAPEFLEALQLLCTAVVVALEDAFLHQQQCSSLTPEEPDFTPLSERLASHFASGCFRLVGTERSLSPSTTQTLLQAARALARQHCTYCRLTYLDEAAVLEAVLPPSDDTVYPDFVALAQAVTGLKGNIDIVALAQEQTRRMLIQLPIATILEMPVNILSTRELEILMMLARGLRDKEIAEQLFISERTVKFHINNVLSKCQARTRAQAMYQATRHGWLTPV